MAELITGRFGFGVCSIRHLIFVFGGGDTNNEDIQTCEQYHILKNTWTELPCKLSPGFCKSVTVESV
jgi:hypothetical protein